MWSVHNVLRLSLSALLLSKWTTAAPSAEIVADSPIEARQDDRHWVATWTSMPQLVESNNMPPSPFASGGATFRDATLRQTLHLTIGTERLRIQISNTFGGASLPVTAASIAFPTGGKAGVGGIDTASLKPLTFNNGAASIDIARGQVAYTDPIDFVVPADTMITVTLYFKTGQASSSITGHPGSRTTSWMQTGNQVNAASVTGANTKHWYFLSAIESWAPKNHSALIILGDSITDGRGSTDDANNRWPDLLFKRMVAAGITNVGVNNQAAGGNTVLSGGLGPPLMQRYKRDALSMQGVKYVMIFEGVNDLGNSGTDSGTQQRIGDQLINAFKQIVTECKAAGIKTIGGTITPFGGQGQSYSNPARETTRKRVNTWIMTSGTFDYTVDFSKLIGDASKTDQLGARFDGGDHLHPNVAGFQAMADGFPLQAFQ